MWCILFCTSALITVTNCKFDPSVITGSKSDEDEARQYIWYYDKESSKRCYRTTKAKWEAMINATEEAATELEEAQKDSGEFELKAWNTITSFAWDKFKDEELKRWFAKAATLGDAALPREKLASDVKKKLEENYEQTLFCRYKEDAPDKLDRSECNLKFIPTVNSKLNNLKRSYTERLFYWEQFMDKIGQQSLEPFKEYVSLANEGSRLNGYSDRGEQWILDDYELEDFQSRIVESWDTIRPLFKQVHAYVRKMLREDHKEFIQKDGPIPGHVLGSMWAQSWKSLNNRIRPFPDEPSFDVTQSMKDQGYTVDKMVGMADNFFKSLGMKPATQEFYDNSIFTNENGKGGDCMAVSWEMCSSTDFRMKICADINMNHLITLHHEMGHIQYYMQYAHQPKHFREAANPAFHEAIGDVISLSVQSPEYLKQINLLKSNQNRNSMINHLMSMALEKVSFLPSALIFDLWRWEIFAGKVGFEKLNKRWWDLRTIYQGLCPGVRRTNDDLDPLAKFHVANGQPFISYYVSYILQFQIHKELCRITGHVGPLYECSIYGSKEAGQKLAEIMSPGASKSWRNIIMVLTDNRTSEIEAEALLEYFEPLTTWLKEENKNEFIGWNSNDPMLCPGVDDRGRPL